MKPAAQMHFNLMGQAMDLRRKLVSYLGAVLLGLLLMTFLINLYSLRSDVTTEVKASEQLVRVLLEAGRKERPATPSHRQHWRCAAPARPCFGDNQAGQLAWRRTGNRCRPAHSPG
jgi:hypothetical protein